MKTKFLFFAVLLCFSTVAVSPVFADSNPHHNNNTGKQLTKQEFREAYEGLKSRLDALKVAKKNADTQMEKQKIQDEIKDIKKEAKQLKQQASGGIYIGAGALVVLLVLLLLL